LNLIRSRIFYTTTRYLSGNGAAEFLEKVIFVLGLLRTAQTAQAKTDLAIAALSFYVEPGYGFVGFSLPKTETPSNSRCHGTSNAGARVPSAAIASSVPRGAMNEGSSPSSSADLLRRRRSSSARWTVSVVGRLPERRRETGHTDSDARNAACAASRNA